jgi:tetratricopeptide (TPR) repeat protein
MAVTVDRMPEGPPSAAPSTLPAWASLAQPLPCLAAVGVFLLWASFSGGYFPHAWYAGGLFLAAILLVALLAWPGIFSGVSRATAVALVALSAFTGWSYLSIVWADVKGDAWDGAGRTALYLVVFTLFALWRVPVWGALALMGAFALGIALLGFVTLALAASSDDAGPYFIGGRFIDPIGYVNGNAALFVLAFWPALFLASRREVPTALRPLFLAAAGVLLQLALLPQSRGAILAFPLVLLVYVALVPGRVRSVVFLLPIGFALAVVFQRLLDLAHERSGAGLAAGSRSAAITIAVIAALLFVLGLALAVADRRLEFSTRARRLGARALAVVAGACLFVGIVATLLLVDVGARANSAWDQLNAPPVAATTGSNRLTSGLQSNRADLWRVALAQFSEHPLVGIGAENFGVAYVRDRRSDEETLYPHSFPLQVLTQTGLVGAVLMAAFLAAAIAAAARSLRGQSGLAAGIPAVGLVIFVSWLMHGSIDWFWELPALAAPALAFLALAGASGEALPTAASRRARTASRVATVLGVAVAASFIPPWLAARETRSAALEWRVDPAGAAARLDRARRLNPLTDRADLTAGSIARRREDWDAMAAAYERALERNPHSWYSRLQLALARAEQGNRTAAVAQLELAERLNPTEPTIDLVSDWLSRGQPVNVREVAQILLDRHARVTGGELESEPTRKP